jgi:DNA repair exonuclease SbcCD ATPase subunit
MNGYQEALERVHRLIAEWRELLANEHESMASGDPQRVLETITKRHSLPHEAHRVIVEAAGAGADFYNKLAAEEEQHIQQLDAELQPLLEQLRELQQRVDRLLRARRGHEHRLAALKTYANEARSLSALDPSRVNRPEDAEMWLGKLPPPSEPPPAQPVEKVFA